MTTITVGTTVEWVWQAPVQHSTTSGTCDASNCIPGPTCGNSNSASKPRHSHSTYTSTPWARFPYFCPSTASEECRASSMSCRSPASTRSAIDSRPREVLGSNPRPRGGLARGRFLRRGLQHHPAGGRLDRRRRPLLLRRAGLQYVLHDRALRQRDLSLLHRRPLPGDSPRGAVPSRAARVGGLRRHGEPGLPCSRHRGRYRVRVRRRGGETRGDEPALFDGTRTHGGHVHPRDQFHRTRGNGPS